MDVAGSAAPRVLACGCGPRQGRLRPVDPRSSGRGSGSASPLWPTREMRAFSGRSTGRRRPDGGPRAEDPDRSTTKETDMTGKFDAQQEVTDRIIAAIEAGTPPPAEAVDRRPGRRGAFRCGPAASPVGSTSSCSGSRPDAKGYTSPHWFTHRQAQELGPEVGKGEVGAGDQVRHLRHEEGRAGERGCRNPQGDVHQALPSSSTPTRSTGWRKLLPPAGADRDLRTEPDAKLEAFFAATGAIIDTSDDPRAYTTW